MSPALNFQGYSNYRNDFIFVSSELPKRELEQNIFFQEVIVNAFHNPYLRTQSAGRLENKNIVFVTPKYT